MINSVVSFFPCTSIEKTAEFYTNVIQLECVHNTPGVRIFSCRGGYIGFVEYDEAVNVDRHICISFNCKSNEEVQSEYKRLCELGVSNMTEPQMHPVHPVYSFFLYDPDGYRLEYQKIPGEDL